MGKLICNGRHVLYDPELKELSRKLRNGVTPQEKKLWKRFLKFQKLYFYRQKPLDCYIADFYCPKVVRFSNYQIDNEFEKICEQINNLINIPL